MLFSTKLIKVHALSCTYIHNLSSTYAPPGNLFGLSSTLGICEGFHFLNKNLSTKVSFVDCWLQVWKLTSFVYIMDNKSTPIIILYPVSCQEKSRFLCFVVLTIIPDEEEIVVVLSEFGRYSTPILSTEHKHTNYCVCIFLCI